MSREHPNVENCRGCARETKKGKNVWKAFRRGKDSLNRNVPFSGGRSGDILNQTKKERLKAGEKRISELRIGKG